MTEDHSGGARAKATGLGSVVNLVLVALAFVLLGLVLWQNRDKIRAVFAHPLDLRLLAIGVLIFQFSLLITYVRWYLLVRVIEPRFTLRSTLVLGFIGYVFNLVIPGAVGGDFIKAAYLVRMHIKKTQAVASMVIDRILGLLGLFVLAALAGAVAWSSVDSSEVRKLIVAAWIATGLAFLVLVLIFTQAVMWLFPGLGGSGHGRLAGIMTELIAMSTTYRRRLDVVFLGLVLSVLGHTLNVLAFYLMSRMLFPTTLHDHADSAFLDGTLDALHDGCTASFRSTRPERGGRRPDRQACRPPWGCAGDAGLPCLDVRVRADQCLRLPGESSRGPQLDRRGSPSRERPGRGVARR